MQQEDLMPTYPAAGQSLGLAVSWCGLACPRVVQLLVLKALHPGQPFPWPGVFGRLRWLYCCWLQHEHHGCYLGNPCTTYQGVAQTCLLSPYPGWLACQLANLGVSVSGWYFAERCNLILCCELADAQSGASYWLVVHHANHSYTLLVHCWQGFTQTQRVSPHLPTKYHTDKPRHPRHLRSEKNIR